MVRPGEAARTRWDEIDLDNALWTLPIKSPVTNKRTHTVPLSPQALSLIEVMRPISGTRIHLFPGDRKPKQHTNSQTANTAIKRMGYKNILVAHGLRSLASTTFNEAGYDPDVIETALSHLDKNEVRRAYNHVEYIERRRVMMNWWSEHIESAATGNMSLSDTKKSLRVVTG